MKSIARGSGRSAVAAAAYRSATRIENQRDGLVHDFSRKMGVEHSEIVLPEGVSADWAKDRSALWNAAELAEKRKDARVAREFEVALPHELTAAHRLELTRDFARELANRYSAAVDFSIHAPHGETDIRNFHAHVMMTTRQIGPDGLGDKTLIERENKWLLTNTLPTTQMQLVDVRRSWEQVANAHLARAGLDLRIDHRSHQERGLEIVPTEHMGVHATQLHRRGQDVSRSRLDAEAAKRNAGLIRDKPEQVLTIITNEKSVFDRHDVARALHRYLNDDVQEFRDAFAKVMASLALVELRAERADQVTGEVDLARYSTREMVEIESDMVESAQRMHQTRTHGVDRRHVGRAIERQDAAIQRSAGETTARLSDEQRRAIEHITGPEQIAAIVGFAGAGKSTMLAAAREAWEAEGYSVHGAALAGKAAEGLEESSGIQSRTLASWEHRWQAGRDPIGRSDIFVIDEAGMIGSRQLSRFVREAGARGAKIVLVGDHEQLQAIGAGAPFRAIAEEIGHAELSEIRRQRVDWQREASVSFATHKTAEGLAAYAEHGDIRFNETREGARGAIVRDYLADRDERPEGTRVAMAHRRIDVRAINDEIRTALQGRGELAKGEEAGELTFQTNDGKREFSPGDRIVFLENNRDLGVKNGMLGTVDHVEPGRLGASPRIIATLDGPTGAEGRSVSVSMGDYQAIDHGYATTIHKNQGATVDRSFVLASGTMDRHLTYVAMTRHRDGAQLYAGQDEFTDRHAGRLVEHGAAPYEHKEGNRKSYFVTLETDQGQRRTIWGVDLERAMKSAERAPEIGEKIGLQHTGSEPVRLPDGTTGERHTWKVRDAGEVAYSQLENCLSRSGAKETTLDYVSRFAERRGIADRLGIRSEIEVHRPDAQLGHGEDIGQAKRARGLVSEQAQPGQTEGMGPERRISRPESVTQTNVGANGLQPDSSQSRSRDLVGAEKPVPLVPAITHYKRSIEEVAREKAMLTFDQKWNDAVQSVARHVYSNAEVATARLRTTLIDKGVDGSKLERAVTERPEQFGDLRGKTGLFGENKERKEARTYAQSLGKHVGYAGATWDRRLNETRASEQWQREKRDTVEVPGLTRQSAEIFSQIEQVPQAERNRWINQLRSTPEGKAALEEAKTIHDALRQRFGHSDPRQFAKELDRNPALLAQAETIKKIAQIVERTRAAELNRDHALRQEISRGKGLGLSR